MKHPNAIAGTVSGVGLGALIAYLLALVGIHIPQAVAPAIGGIASGLVLFLGRNGLRGAIRLVWKGSG